MNRLRPRILVAEPDDFNAAAANLLKQVGELVCEKCSRQRLMSIIADFDALMIRLNHRVDAELISAAPRLVAVATATTGLTHVDLEELEARGISLLSLKGETDFLNTITATAELAWGLVIALARRLPEAAMQISTGAWNRDCIKGNQLCGKTLGIVGFGRLGRMVASYGEAFRMQILAYDPHVLDYPAHVSSTSFDELLSNSDIVSLHLTSNAETFRLIGRRELALMRRSAFLVNTSRGEVVDEEALLHSLREGQIAGAALDTICDEGGADVDWLNGRPVWRYAEENSNLILTPHVGGATIESLPMAETYVAEKLAHFLENKWPAGPCSSQRPELH